MLCDKKREYLAMRFPLPAVIDLQCQKSRVDADVRQQAAAAIIQQPSHKTRDTSRPKLAAVRRADPKARRADRRLGDVVSGRPAHLPQ